MTGVQTVLFRSLHLAGAAAQKRYPVWQMVEMDIDYILHRNLAMDISIVFKTILAMIRKDGE